MIYPTLLEDPVIISTPKKTKAEPDIEFYVDIENTLIDSLKNVAFLDHNCDNIKEYIHKHDIHHYHVHIFTCGWIYREEIDLNLINSLYERLNIDRERRGKIIVKKDLVDAMFSRMPGMPLDQHKLLQPGGLANELGISKPCAWEALIDSSKVNVLIDDLVSEYNIDRKGLHYINPANFKVVIRHYLDKPAHLYTPDGILVGEVMDIAAERDVCRQIAAQRLNGYYFLFDGQKLNIDTMGNVVFEGDPDHRPHDFFNTIDDAADDMSGDPKTSYAKLEHIYPQVIDPNEVDCENE